MCGVAGALSFGQASFRLGHGLIERMLTRIAHRGPDGAGVWVSEDHRIALGHRRLSIIDLSPAAAQPMCNEDESLWVSFNGEIYNHQELRRELEQSGRHRWKTDHSDTEVILHAFEQWGIDCLPRFRGMFAIALWDARKRELWLIRDRIGIKPLYYSLHHGRITFASEIKALLEDPGQERNLDEEAFYHFLSFLTTPAPYTLFHGIRKLPAGHWLRVREDGGVQLARYWDVWDNTEPLTETAEPAITARLLEELRTAVRLRKLSDVPIGLFLSGGLDSSVNAALFSEGETSPVRSFSIGYDLDYHTCPNELHHARRMADFVGAQYHERRLSQHDLLDCLPEMVQLQDEPIADPVCVPVYYLARLAREHGVTVCQLGEGSDELFCGYPTWKLKLHLQRCGDLRGLGALKQAGLWTLRAAGREDSLEYEALRRNVCQLPVFWGGAEAFTEPHKRKLLAPRLRHKFAHFSSWEVLSPIRSRFEERAWEQSTLNWMSYLDLNLRLPELLLMRVDKMTMGAGLEARVPFLDHKLVELVMSVPTAVKQGNGELKYLLKKAVRGLVPDEIVKRKKQGFAVPVSEWFFDRLGQFARDEIQSFCHESGLLDWPAVAQLLERRDGKRAWYLLNVALWWKQCISDRTNPAFCLTG